MSPLIYLPYLLLCPPLRQNRTKEKRNQEICVSPNNNKRPQLDHKVGRCWWWWHMQMKINFTLLPSSVQPSPSMSYYVVVMSWDRSCGRWSFVCMCLSPPFRYWVFAWWSPWLVDARGSKATDQLPTRLLLFGWQYLWHNCYCQLIAFIMILWS